MNDFQKAKLKKIMIEQGVTRTANYLEWARDEVDALSVRFQNCPWRDGMELRSQSSEQIGMLVNLMDLERDDRLELLELLVGHELWWDGVQYEDVVLPSGTKARLKYYTHGRLGARSSKDPRITRWMAKVLIDYYLSGEGRTLNDNLGYRSRSDQISERRTQRELERARKSAEREARRLQRQSHPKKTRTVRVQAGDSL